MISDIEEFENQLIDAKYLKEAYDNMNLIQYPTIHLDDHAISALMAFSRNIINKVLNKVKEEWNHPLFALATYLSRQEWAYNQYHNKMAIFSSPTCFEYLTTPRKCVRLDSIGLVFNDILLPFEDRLWIINPRVEDLCFSPVIVENNFLAYTMIWVDGWYQSFSEDMIARFQFYDVYFEIIKSIQEINVAIQLTNLRCLQMELRKAIRVSEHKKAIENSIES